MGRLKPFSICLLALLLAGAAISPAGAADSAGAATSASHQRVKGLLVPFEQARLASRAQGLIARVKEEGERVAKGEVLLELESAMENLQVEQQRHVLALRDFEWKSTDTLRTKDVVSRTEAEEKRIAREIADVQLAQAVQLLDRRKVYAPFDGVVTEKMRHVGEAVDEFVPVLQVVNVDTLYLELFLPASRRSSVHEGLEVMVETPAQPGRSFPGRVARLSGAVNPASGEFKVRIIVPNPGHTLTPGTEAYALLPDPPAAAAGTPAP